MPAARAVSQLGQNVAIAVAAIRASKLRSALTILGVVIGVSTVMTMASLVQGIRDQIVRTIEIAGPTTFYVLKVFSQTPVDPNRLPKYIRIRPDLQEEEAARIRALPEIEYASLWGQAIARVEFEGARTQNVAVFGSDEGFTTIQGGELAAGRWFTHAEVTGGDAVALGKRFRWGGKVAESIKEVAHRMTSVDKIIR
jgi:putative ABC transport system permease protein